MRSIPTHLTCSASQCLSCWISSHSLFRFVLFPLLDAVCFGPDRYHKAAIRTLPSFPGTHFATDILCVNCAQSSDTFSVLFLGCLVSQNLIKCSKENVFPTKANIPTEPAPVLMELGSISPRRLEGDINLPRLVINQHSSLPTAHRLTGLRTLRLVGLLYLQTHTHTVRALWIPTPNLPPCSQRSAQIHPRRGKASSVILLPNCS